MIRFTCALGRRRPAFTERELWIFTAGYALGVALTTFIICLFVCRN